MTTANLAGLSVVIVEDEGAQAMDLQLSLEEAGASVVGPVGFLDDALGLVEQLPELDCAILDLSLHGDMVFPVADILMAHRVPIILATAYDTTQLPTRYRSLPAFQKPLSMEQITRTIETELSVDEQVTSDRIKRWRTADAQLRDSRGGAPDTSASPEGSVHQH